MRKGKPNPRRAELRALSEQVRPLVKAGAFPTVNAAILALYSAETGASEWRTFHQWRELGRPVKKGESGFPVWAQPQRLKGERSSEEAAPAADPSEHNEANGPEWFPVCYLFHAGQVEAADVLAVAA